MSQLQPPPPSLLARIALRWLLSEDERRVVLNELGELWEKRVNRDGEQAARRWYARQLRGYPWRLLGDRLRVIGGTLKRETRSDSESRDGTGFFAGMGADARHALRAWVKSPVLALTIVLTVGLGLGASTAMFAVVRVVLLNALPYTDSGRLVRIYHALGTNRWPLSVVDYQAIESQQTQFDGVAAFSGGQRTLTLGNVAERVRVRAVTAGWFDLLGIRALQGRTFTAEDGKPGAPATAVVSWSFWQQRLDGDAAALGRPIRLDGQDFTVIGVLPRNVGPFEERQDIFPALQMTPPTRRGPFGLQIIGRLRSGVNPATAAAELRTIDERTYAMWSTGTRDPSDTFGMMPLDEFVIGRFRPMLLLLMGAVVLVLIVASTNAAGLLTARATQRQTELATRAALGASRPQLIRLLVTESLLLALGGATLGMALANIAIRAIRAAGPALLPRAGFIVIDNAVIAFAALLTCASLAVFGLIPALQLIGGRSGISQALRASGRTATAALSAHNLRRALVASQFAIAVPLLAGAALLINSFVRLQRVDAGFDGARVLTVSIDRPAMRDTTGANEAFWAQLLERVRGLPGVTSAGLNSGRPPREVFNINNFDPLDRPTPPGQTEPLAVWLTASPGYFEALRIRLVEGRMFDERDQAEADGVSAIVDRDWVKAIYPDESPIGKRLYEGGCKSEECETVTVVGVVENVRYLGLDDSQRGAAVGTLYEPYTQSFTNSFFLYIRSSGDPLSLLGSVRAIVRELDPTIPVTNVALADDLVDAALAAPRNLTSVVLAFAVVALLLATIGIYGVMSYFVQEHRKDIGIRLALGGRPASVLRLVVARGMRPVVLGTAVGLGIAIGATRFISRLLFNVSPQDPATLGLVAFAMLGTAVVACWLPARHASRMDPAQVLRHD